MYLRHFRRQCEHSRIWNAGEPRARRYGRLLFWRCGTLLVLRRYRCFVGRVEAEGCVVCWPELARRVFDVNVGGVFGATRWVV